MFISDHTIKELHNLNCETVAIEFGLKVTRHQAHCFMHDDKHPSLAFKNNRWKCFSCDKGGDAISLIEEMFNLSFQKSCILLCKHFNISFSAATEKATVCNFKCYKQIPAQQIKPQENILEFDREVAVAIINFLTLGKKGKDFLFTERMLSPDVIKKMNIKSIENVNPLKNMLLSRFDRTRLIQCKLLKKDN